MGATGKPSLGPFDMLQLRKRWPVLTALAAVLAYSANHYQIGGLENLRIEPRQSPGGAKMPDYRVGIDGFDAGSGTLPWELQTATSSAPQWNNGLTLGEKFALWQDKLDAASRSASNGLPAMEGFNASLPIPVPVGLAPTQAFQAAASLAGNQLMGTASVDFPVSSIPNTLLPSASPQTNLGGIVRADAATGSGKRIRIASFNLGGLGPSKLAKAHVAEALVRILRQYDVVALQAIQSIRDDILPILTERLNQSGRSFDYLIGPRVGRGEAREQFAFLFDTGRVETDRYQLYSVEDPEELLTFDPLVAWFRCKEVQPARAFTFSLVNVRFVATEWSDERQLLPNIIQAVVQDGRQEDDWIIVGDMGGNPSELRVDRSTVRFAFSDIPTDVIGERANSAILFSGPGTVEFTGRSGAFDFLRKFNLSLERSLEISDNLPVWAEFSIVEGGEPGRIAPMESSSRVF